MQAADICKSWVAGWQGPGYPLWAHMLISYCHLHMAEDEQQLQQVDLTFLAHDCLTTSYIMSACINSCNARVQLADQGCPIGLSLQPGTEHHFQASSGNGCSTCMADVASCSSAPFLVQQHHQMMHTVACLIVIWYLLKMALLCIFWLLLSLQVLSDLLLIALCF